MENRTSTKNVTIKDRVYQINKVDARTVCWLFSFLGARCGDGAILTGLGRCTRQEFDDIQSMALSKIFWMDTKDGATFPTAVVGPSGAFSDPSLAEDAETVMRLTSDFLMFNLSPFFVDRGSNSQKQENQAGTQ